jgi:hypothetical protein
MKKLALLTSSIAALLMLSLATPCYADDDDKGKEQTITGDAKCAKCALSQGEKCQTVIQVEKDGKTVTYYLADNKVAKEFHSKVCKETKKVTATGTVKKVDDKEELTVAKIEVVEK